MVLRTPCQRRNSGSIAGLPYELNSMQGSVGMNIEESFGAYYTVIVLNSPTKQYHCEATIIYKVFRVLESPLNAKPLTAKP